jgi:ribosomal protein L11 methyltransferase
MSAWLAVTAVVEARWADAFSESLLWAGAESSAIDAPDAPAPCVSALLAPSAEPAALVAAAAAHCGLAPAPSFSLERLADDDWVRRTQAQFAPLELERLWIGASWHRPPGGKAVLRLDPGLAFGTGSHATTRLMLGFIEREVSGGERVLDYGCGSGILAIAAAKLGARKVDAVDVDPQALETARANAAANAVPVEAHAAEALAAGCYDLVLSNILAQPLIVLAPLLASRTARGGRLALAGLLTPQAREVASAYAGWFDLRIDAQLDGWALLAGKRK